MECKILKEGVEKWGQKKGKGTQKELSIQAGTPPSKQQATLNVLGSFCILHSVEKNTNSAWKVHTTGAHSQSLIGNDIFGEH